jgi:hypothetical protein
VSAATPRHLPIVWRDWISGGSQAVWSAVDRKNAENITIVKIYKEITYLTSNRG